MPKKIALLSFHKSENYGAILQAYALQRVLEDMGCIAGYMDYPSHNRMSLPRRLLNIANRTVRSMLGYRKRAGRTRQFRTENIHTAVAGSTGYDAYVVGSDQVWHPEYLASSEDFFLLPSVQGDAPKYSYASSFGLGALPGSAVGKYKDNLSGFRRIGIRERSGLRIAADMGLEATLTPDPTLLLDGKEWSRMAAPRQTGRKYIFCYVMQGDGATARYVEQVARTLKESRYADCDIIFMGDKEYKKLRPGYHLVTDAGPREFLSYILHAEFVITSSFHGTCFSIKFHKPFLTVQRPDNPVNSRIVDMLEHLGASDRLVFSDSGTENLPAGNPDYALISGRLEAFARTGKDFLKGIADD